MPDRIPAYTFQRLSQVNWAQLLSDIKLNQRRMSKNRKKIIKLFHRL